MRKGKLYIPQNSALYYASIIVAAISIICKFWYNISCYGAPNEELAGMQPVSFISMGFEGAELTWLGWLHLTADIILPIGFALSFKRLWLAGLSILAQMIYMAISGIYAVVMFSAGTVLFQYFASMLEDYSDPDSAAAIFYIFILIIAMMCTLALALAVLPQLVTIIAAVSQIIVYTTAYKGTLRSNAVVAVITSAAWAVFAVVLFISALLMEKTDTNSGIPLLIINLMPAVSALLLAMSMKNQPCEAEIP